MITLSTGSFYYYGLERVLEIGVEAGFESFELMLCPLETRGYLDTWESAYLNKLQLKYGVQFNSIHTDFSFEEKPRDMGSILRLADRLKAKHVVLHIPRLKKDLYKRWFDNFVGGGGLDLEPRILVENMGRKAIYRSLTELQSFPNFCFDTCHSIKAGEDPVAMLRSLPNTRQLHISNFTGNQSHVCLDGAHNLFRRIVLASPGATRCVELSPQAFRKNASKRAIVRKLSETREFLEQI